MSASRLAHFPVTFFAVTMGLGGLTLALHAGGYEAASQVVLWLDGFVLVMLGAAYVAKWLRHPDAARAEWHHPVKIAFFPTLSISLLLLATALLPMASGAAHMLWGVAALAQFALTLAVVSGWLSRDHFATAHLTPAWFIPAVGNVIVPLAGVPLGYHEISWFFFSVGVVFWVVLLTLVFNRLVFHDPLPARLFPTLVILIAPPAVAFVAWTRLTGEVDAFARILLNAGYLFAAIVAVQVPRLARLPFVLSFWALSFPLAALTVASFVFAHETGSGVHHTIGLTLLVLLVLVVLGLILRTIKAMMANEICVPE